MWKRYSNIILSAYADDGLVCDDENYQAGNYRTVTSFELGYDVFKADVWVQGRRDPGIRHNIFKITCKTDKDTPGIYEYVNHDWSSISTATQTSVTSYQSFYNEYYSSNNFEYAAEVSTEGEASYGGVGVNWRAKFNKHGSTEEQNMKKLFQDGKAEIVIGYKKCSKVEMHLLGYLRPLFSSEFLVALKGIDDHLSNNDIAAAESKMEEFIDNFGTHYYKSAEMGYALRYEQRFASKSRDSSEETQRKDCSGFGVDACVGATLDAGMTMVSF